MKQALFFLVPQYADWEGAYLANFLNNNANWTVKTAANKPQVPSMGGFMTTVDYTITQIPDNLDLLVLIGGQNWPQTDLQLTTLITKQLQQQRPVGAICGAVDYLARQGLLNNYQHTGNASELWQNYSQYHNLKQFLAEQAVHDRNLVTANGTAALEFSRLVLKMIHLATNEQIDKDIALYQLGYYQYCQKYGNPYY